MSLNEGVRIIGLSIAADTGIARLEGPLAL